MNKTAFLPLLVLSLCAVSSPAFATHPNEACEIKLDVAALSKAAGVDPASVRVRFVFGGGMSGMTDMNPPAPVVASRPAEGAWIFKTEIHSNLYYRKLAAVVLESILYKPVDGKPEWTIRVDRTEADDAKKDSPIRCVNYAD